MVGSAAKGQIQTSSPQGVSEAWADTEPANQSDKPKQKKSKRGDHVKVRPEMQRKARDGKPRWTQVHHTTRAKEAERDAAKREWRVALGSGGGLGVGSWWVCGGAIRFT
jgi:hypothetical protein